MIRLYLETIALQNFRSYAESRFRVEPCGALITGPNGSGKTNLLEAIAYCGIGKSIRFHHDEQLLRFGNTSFGLHATFMQDNKMGLTVNLAYRQNKKTLRMDEVLVRQLSSLFQAIKIIYCAPDDMQLVNGSPRLRRQYFDLAISQIFPDYVSALREYLHIVEQRNILLKANPDKVQKQSWDIRFAEACIIVYSYRQRYLQLLNPELKSMYCSSHEFLFSIAYLHAFKADNHDHPTRDSLLSYLCKIDSKERHYQRSMIGAHVDDYEMKMDNMSLKLYGSQGQKRSSVVNLKLAQAKLIDKITKIRPILLLDDIFAEMDTDHALRIREATDRNSQIIIASPKSDIHNIWPHLPLQSMGTGGCA